MSTPNNGVSLKFIGFFVFLALTMNCLSLVSGAATDNKGAAEVCTCAYLFKEGTATASDNSASCDCPTCKGTFQGYSYAYMNTCSALGDPCQISATNNINGLPSTVNGICMQGNNGWCCSNSPQSAPLGAAVTMCECKSST